MGSGMAPGLIGSNKLCRSVHTAPKQGQGQGPGPIVSYCATPVSCIGPDPCPAHDRAINCHKQSM